MATTATLQSTGHEGAGFDLGWRTEQTPNPRRTWSSGEEAAFRAESSYRGARTLLVVTIATSSLILLWGIGDFLYFPELANRFLLIRLAEVAWLGTTCAIALKAESTAGRYAAIWLWFLALALDTALMAPSTPEHVLVHVIEIVMAQIGSIAVVVWRWPMALTMSLALVAIGQAGLSRFAAEGYDLFAAQAYLITGVVVSVTFTVLRYNAARAQFAQRLELAKQKQQTDNLLLEVRAMRDERLHWLENLARFLRHELRNQVTGFDSSLDLLETADSVGLRARYIGRARDSLGRMNRLIANATEATSLEAAIATMRRSDVDLSEVVAECVAIYRHANGDRTFVARVEDDIRVDGSADHIAQVLNKLLDNAVQHTQAGATIRVSLSRHIGVAVLEVENDGDPLPDRADRLFQAFTSEHPNGAKAHNLGLGLFVAKTIVDAHGGRITARPARGRSGACFEVKLDEIKPHRTGSRHPLQTRLPTRAP
ncbi:MAG: HAMP domain-containing sensor histidine kinase [Myxococcota bacterium]